MVQGRGICIRRRVFAAVTVLAVALASCAALAGPAALFAPVPAAEAAGTLTFTPFLTGLHQPVFAAQPPDGTNRWVVALREGPIRIAVNGVVQSTPFLDVTSLITAANLEQGLLGLAFHPAYATNGYFFIYYTATNGANTLVRYKVSSSNPNQADPTSRTVLFAEQDQTPNHNGGMLAFGPDGFLYIAIGDDATGGGTPPHAQRLDVVFGKILRIDVNSGNPYAIPPSNPFVGRAGARGEIWALGLRNPWRFSFDRATGDLWIGDVGEVAREEIDRQPAGAAGGANYQWPCREGQHVNRSDLTCGQGVSTPPVFEYAHGDAPCSAVTGGYVYRGSAMPGFLGAYLYTDSCQNRVWALRGSTSTGWTNTLLATLNASPVSFMEDRAGELYLADFSAQQQILRLSEAGVPTPTPMPTSTPTPTPRPSEPSATPTPTATATPLPASTATPTITPVASLPSLTVTFDSLPAQAGILSGELPEGVINWGQNAWVHLPPFGNFPSPSITFAEASNQITNGWFTLVGGRRLVSLDAYNVGPTLSYVSLGCFNAQQQLIQPVRIFSIDSNQAMTLRANWTAPCAVVTLGSATGQLVHFDNLVVESLGPDLVITSFTATDGTTDADPHLTVTVRNRGDTSTAGFPSDVHVFADLGRPPTTADFGFKAHLGGIDLAPGASWTGETHFPDLAPGSHTLWALADAHNVLRESDETNNVASASVRIANLAKLTVTFDNLPPRAELLTGEYPAGVINWGSNRWVHLAPGGRFNSKSLTFAEQTTEITNSWFEFVTEGRLVALDAFNLTASVSYVSLGCYNAQQQLVQPVQFFTLQPDTISTLQTGWTGRCTVVTVGSANGQMTHFDNLVVDSVQP